MSTIHIYQFEQPEGSDEPEIEEEEYHFVCIKCKKALHWYGEICPVCGGEAV